jgi:H+/Cl- antiporter ClcA
MSAISRTARTGLDRLKDSHLNIAVATVTVGVVAGLTGMALGLLLRFVQHTAYGYGFPVQSPPESFLEGVTAASSLRRFLALCICGAIGGIGWWSLYRYARPLVSVEGAIRDKGRKMPILSTCVNSLLQIVTVGLGSPLGREAAPREVAASFADYLSDRFGLSYENRRIMIACGAGAGLAAVYNVPLSGALFTLEVLLGSFALPAVIPALATSVIATVIAWIGLGNLPAFYIQPPPISSSLATWSILTGPLFGLAAYGFLRGAEAARRYAPHDWHLLLWCGLAMPALGLLATRFPQLLGNGKGIEQMGFNNLLGPGLAAILFLLKLLVTLGALRAGMKGGLMTPALALGGSLGILLGTFWNHVSNPAPAAAYAIVGSAAFLASSSKMPLTAIVLVVEFTRVGHDFWIPLSLGIVGSAAVSRLCIRLYQQNRDLAASARQTT